MSNDGYYRHPAIFGDQIVFVCEDDLWAVPASGGSARRLTCGLGAAAFPALSRDGKTLAFSGRDEGHLEVYSMPAEGGQPKRLTYLGANSLVTGFNPDGRIIFISDAKQPFMKRQQAFVVDPQNGEVSELPTGPANFVSYDPNGSGVVIARPQVEAAYWKRYHGGTAGDIWIDARGDGNFRRLIKLKGNPSRPLWIGDRIYFLCDHEGVGNVYSCTTTGEDLRRHTHHEDFYARTAASDGKRIVYHAGGDLFLFDVAKDESKKIKIEFHSPRVQRNRKFVEAAKYLENYEPHPQGHLLALTVRGKFITLGSFDGPVQQHGEPAPGRFRLAQWLNDGKRLVVVSDAEGRETLEIHRADELAEPEKLAGLDVGRVVSLSVSPKADQVALTNHRNELVLVDLPSKTSRVLDRSEHSPMLGFDFSPDGKWLAYGCAETLHTSVIKLCRLEDGAITRATRPVLNDLSPTFDPEGKYLYFLSRREFDPVYDGLHFDLGFPKGIRPYLITLRKDLPNPFALQPKAPEEPKKDTAGPPASAGGADSKPETPFSIDLEGIENRLVAFPVAEGIYRQIEAIAGKALFTSVPIEGALKLTWIPGGEPPSKAKLESWDFAAGKSETLVKNITSFSISRDRKTLVYRAGLKLRVMKAGEKSDDAAAAKPPGRESGWIDLKRVRLSVDPPSEWRQMFGEAWRLQREHFWVDDLSQVDWKAVYDRYLPLLDRVATRIEFTDLLTEMHGELGSSHAYVIGGDFRDEPRYDLGFLGAELALSTASREATPSRVPRDSRVPRLWKISRIIPGDPWDEEKGSPLLRPGANINVGDTILAVNGQRVDENISPHQLLVHQAGVEVMLTIGDPDGKNPRVVPVKTLKAEMPLHYRGWVEKNRDYVHKKSGGKFGYVHIPNMGAIGYAEFHRYFLAEVDREGLVIDVRYNGGGHVSSLLLEKLARRRRGYVQTRWFGVQPHPDDCPAGPMVCITNEYAGSDGDIFSHNFKLMKLGPLLGKRTWGGVIGIWPRHTLIDGGLTTQPEFSFWFVDVGWNVENYGVDPDIEVEYRPQDYVAGIDPQLDRALLELEKSAKNFPPGRELDPRPNLALPRGLRSSNGNGDMSDKVDAAASAE